MPKRPKLMPVYYYNFTFPQKDLDYLNASKLKVAALSIKKIKDTDTVFTLYKLQNISTTTPAVVPKF